MIPAGGICILNAYTRLFADKSVANKVSNALSNVASNTTLAECSISQNEIKFTFKSPRHVSTINDAPELSTRIIEPTNWGGSSPCHLNLVSKQIPYVLDSILDHRRSLQ